MPSVPACPVPFALFTQPRRLCELMPSFRATQVTVPPEEATNAIASRFNSSEYRFV
ncbi:hypothetical protein GCM10009646_83740 [Streptomyces aureus]